MNFIFFHPIFNRAVQNFSFLIHINKTPTMTNKHVRDRYIIVRESERKNNIMYGNLVKQAPKVSNLGKYAI